MQATQLPLKDIHLPDPISWWPPAIGWWMLALLIPLLIGLVIWLYKKITAKSAIKTANKLLASIKLDKQRDNLLIVSELSALIRRVAISVSPREKAASLTGQQWLSFLDHSMKGSPFTQGIGRLFADAPYRKTPPTESEVSQLIVLCEEWLKAQTKYKS